MRIHVKHKDSTLFSTVMSLSLNFNSISLKCLDEFKIFHKTKFKDPNNQHWSLRMLVVWELFPNVVGL